MLNQPMVLIMFFFQRQEIQNQTDVQLFKYKSQVIKTQLISIYQKLLWKKYLTNLKLTQF